MDVMRKERVWLALGVILLVAAGLRLYGLNWDEGQHVHPDERWIAMVAPTIAWPERTADLLNPRRSTLNPLWMPDGRGGGQVRNFAYGHLPLYLQSLVGHALAAVGQDMLAAGGVSNPGHQEVAQALRAYAEYGGITLVGRALSMLFDLGTIYLVYLLGRRIYDTRVGLLGAALVAVAVMHIQASHFATFDVMTTFFIALSLYGAVCVAQAGGRDWWPIVGAGAAAGLAVASKFSAIPLLVVLAVAQVIRTARHAGQQGRHVAARALWRALPPIAVGLSAALLAFFIASPFALLDWKLYLKQILEQGAMVRGQADWPFTRQYHNTTPFLYQIAQQTRWGLWWPLGVTAFAGFSWTIVRQFRRVKVWGCRQAYGSVGVWGSRPGNVRPRAEEWVLLGWTVPYFLLTGTFMVKFMRYMLPLLPPFILMGAAMSWEISKWANGQIATRTTNNTNNTQHATRTTNNTNNTNNTQHATRITLSAIPYLVLAASTLYALAFMRVYAQEHPWIQASRWIYAHVPDGSVIAVEHWDDHLPLSLPIERGTPAEHQYVHVELPMYEPDGPDKYDLIRARLREADYAILASNRLYRSIPRMPERYPVSTEFYRLLFAERLGYVHERTFTAYPGLFGLAIRDDDADESFTVYDHPKPIVFRKVRDLDDQEWDALFREALARQPVWELRVEKRGALAFLSALGKRVRDNAPPAEGEVKRTLLLDRPVGELPVVADFGWNHWASNSTVGAVLLWWLAVAILGWLAWPLTFAALSGLRDRGYLLARAVALLVVGYLVWLPSSLRWIQNGLPLTCAAIGAMTLASALLLQHNWARMKAFLRQPEGGWRVVLMGEAVFGMAFFLFVGIRILNPDLWHPWNGGEKGMDIAYLNACMRSAYAPPYDPYYSDGYLNYYYYGQFLISILTRLTGLTTTVAFNLAVPLYFALTVCHAFSIGYTLAGKKPDSRWGIGHGLLAVLCVTILGNLASATQIIGQLGNLSQSAFTSRIPGLQSAVRAMDGIGQILFHGARFPGFDYWGPSRVVAYTINEFPYWSFLFADLHPHMMNIPFTLLVLALALNWLRRERQPPNRGFGGSRSGFGGSRSGFGGSRSGFGGSRSGFGGSRSGFGGSRSGFGGSSMGCPDREGRPDDGMPLPDGELALVRSSFRYLWRAIDWGEVLHWVLWPLALGALAMINTWDLPAYAGFSGLILLFVWIRARGKQGVLPALLAGVALTAGGMALCAPFFKYYTAIHVGVGWSLGRTHTSMGEYLTVWGFLLFGAVSALLVAWGRRRPPWGVLRLVRMAVRYMPRLHRLEARYRLLVRQPAASYRLSLVGLGVLALAMAGLAWKGYWVLVWMVPLLILAAALMAQAGVSDERRFVLALICTAFLILVGVELFYLKDFLDGLEGWWRMNTLFKFYLQAWSMLGVAVGASLPGLWEAAGRWKAGWCRASTSLWTAAFALLLTAAALFPVLGTPARVLERFPSKPVDGLGRAHPPIGTLDGMAFMRVGVYTWPNESNPIPLYGDYQAIRWLRDHVQGTPVLAEAPIGYYREFGVRVASYTGLPTLLGMHESEQRYAWQVGQRSGQANELFMSSDLQRTMELIGELGIQYVYIGPLERTEYPHTVDKFDQLAFRKLLSVAYQNDLVTIYAVLEPKVEQ